MTRLRIVTLCTIFTVSVFGCAGLEEEHMTMKELLALSPDEIAREMENPSRVPSVADDPQYWRYVADGASNYSNYEDDDDVAYPWVELQNHILVKVVDTLKKQGGPEYEISRSELELYRTRVAAILRFYPNKSDDWLDPQVVIDWAREVEASLTERERHLLSLSRRDLFDQATIDDLRSLRQVRWPLRLALWLEEEGGYLPAEQAEEWRDLEARMP